MDILTLPSTCKWSPLCMECSLLLKVLSSFSCQVKRSISRHINLFLYWITDLCFNITFHECLLILPNVKAVCLASPQLFEKSVEVKDVCLTIISSITFTIMFCSRRCLIYAYSKQEAEERNKGGKGHPFLILFM